MVSGWGFRRAYPYGQDYILQVDKVYQPISPIGHVDNMEFLRTTVDHGLHKNTHHKCFL